MYALDEILKDSAHKNSLFSGDIINAVENLIYAKNIKGVDAPYIKCIIRDKEIKITPEEAVRQLYIYTLINKYGYSKDQIKLEHQIHFGREVKRADIVIFEKSHPNSEYIIIEVKKPKLSDGKEQLKSYCNATGAMMGVWTNGRQISYYHRKDPNYFEDIPDIPNANQKLKDILTERWTIDDLIKKDKLVSEKKSLKGLIEEMEDEVLANAGVNVFEEVFKLIYTKLYDEMQSGRDHSRCLEFRNYGDTDSDLKNNIQELFNKAKAAWPGVFGDNAVIALTPSHLSVCVSSLQDVKLFNSNLDVLDDAFEYLMSKSQKGEKGQFFTPRYIIDMCVKMLNPKKDEKMIDTAAGSCGFPVHTIFYVWKNILAEKGVKQSHLFTAEKKPPECEDYVNNNVFAIDFDENTVRVARTLNLIAGDGKTNVLHLNTLDYDLWDQIIKNDRRWQKIYMGGWLRLSDMWVTENDNSYFNFDIVMANPPFAGDIKESRIITKYELAKNSKGKYQNKIGRDILFIERNLNFLKPGGRMAIVLPQGRFNNSSDKYIRDFIAERCRILAVVGLHGNVFKPHTGTKTSVLFVQKWDDKLCPKKDDYPIFFATMQKPSKDNSGDKIFRADTEGSIILDNNGHMIIDHDLYNHDGLTEDGIAEAFIEFAKRENLSFFDLDSSVEPFYETKYKALAVAIKTFSGSFAKTGRLDAEYYQPKYDKIENMLNGSEIIKNICTIYDKNYNPSDNKFYKYIELANIGTNGSISGVNIYQGIDLPSRARRKVKAGQVIISSIEGSLKSCSLITDEYDGALCSTGFYVLDSKYINSETLLALFQSEPIQALLKRRCSGTILTAYSKEELLSMPLPSISNKIQREIAEKVQKSFELRREAEQLINIAIKAVEIAIEKDESAAEAYINNVK